MGNNFSEIQLGIKDEFERVRQLDKDRDYIVLDQVLQIENTKWESFPIDFTHLGTLFVLDKERNGKFTLNNFLEFSEICKKREEIHLRHDFKTHIQAYLTLCMWSVVAKNNGEDIFVEWSK